MSNPAPPPSASPAGDQSSRLALVAACALAAAFVALRSAPFLGWEQAFFESDQAVVGLMAKHIGEGRDFPLFFYGQKYLLSLDAWLAAPLFALFGPSVFLLKLPAAALNGVAAALLCWLLRRDAGLRVGPAFIAALFFIVPPIIPASRLVSVEGNTAPIMLAVLLVWLARRRPVVLGAVTGLFALARPFVLYALIAVYVVELISGDFFQRRSFRAKTLTALGFVLVQAPLRLAATFDPNYFGQGAPGGGITFQSLGPHLAQLFKENLPNLLGIRRVKVIDYLNGPGETGSPWLGWLLGVVLALLVVRALAGLGRKELRAEVRTHFPLYLVITGGLATVAYALAVGIIRDNMTIRYTMLFLYLPVGVVALAAQLFPGWPARLAMGATLVWAAVSLQTHGALLRDYLRAPPPDRYRDLAVALVARGVKTGMAPYWTAYHVTFLADERVRLASSQVVRIPEYQAEFASATDHAVVVQYRPCGGSEYRVDDWHVCERNVHEALWR